MHPSLPLCFVIMILLRSLPSLLTRLPRERSKCVNFRFVFGSIHRKSTTVENAMFEGYQQPDPKHDAYEQALKTNNKFPCIILVNPFLDQNVGSVARTMMNFGLTELRIVSPEPTCDIYGEGAKALSAGAFDIIKNARVFESLEDCVSDLTHLFATTNRPRHMTQMVYTPHKAAEVALNVTYQDEKVGIMFGRERYGLYNREMAMATGMICIPTFSHFSSLNLAQSVNIIAYELWNRNSVVQSIAPPSQWLQPKDKDRLAQREYLNYYCSRLESELCKRNFSPDPHRRLYVFQAIRNIYQRIMMSKTEVDILQGILTTLINSPSNQETDNSVP